MVLKHQIKSALKLSRKFQKNNNGSAFKWADTIRRKKNLWRARWDVYYSVKALVDNGRVYSTDVCVPISKITECVKICRRRS